MVQFCRMQVTLHFGPVPIDSMPIFLIGMCKFEMYDSFSCVIKNSKCNS